MARDEEAANRGEPGPLELSDDESLVLLHAGEGASAASISASTGLSLERASSALARLSRLGLIEAAAPQPGQHDAKPASEITPEAAPLDALERALATASASPSSIAKTALAEEAGEAASAPSTTLAASAPSTGETGSAAEMPSTAGAAASAPRRPAARPNRSEPSSDDVGVADAGEEAPAPIDASPNDADEARDETPARAAEELNYRKVFETELHPLPAPDRAHLAATESGTRLLALCFDPDPQVVRALLANASAGFEHARLVARHHRTAAGLDAVAARADFVRDTRVRRALLQNPMLPDSILRRLLFSRRLLEIFKSAVDRDVPDRTRSGARTVLRTRWASAESDERVELIWSTEGRALALLPGATFDARTTATLCAKSFFSVMLIQSLARFSATPPMLLGHMLKQPLVKRQPHLRNMLLQHPNAPTDAKRR